MTQTNFYIISLQLLNVNFKLPFSSCRQSTRQRQSRPLCVCVQYFPPAVYGKLLVDDYPNPRKIDSGTVVKLGGHSTRLVKFTKEKMRLAEAKRKLSFHNLHCHNHTKHYTTLQQHFATLQNIISTLLTVMSHLTAQPLDERWPSNVRRGKLGGHFPALSLI